MKLSFLVLLILVAIQISIFNRVHAHGDYAGTNTAETNTVEIQSTDGNLGLMALTAAGLHYDWGVPDKLPLGVSYAFVSGGNQAIAFGGATRLGGFLVNLNVITTVDSVDSQSDEYAFVIGAMGRF